MSLPDMPHSSPPAPAAAEVALKACPFCGANFKMGQEPHDNAPVGGMFYLYHEYGTLGSAARKCPIDVRPHFASAEEAIAAWNTRAADASAPQLVEALEGALDMCAAYADHIRDVPAAEIERHPYLPALEDVIEAARAAILAAKGTK